MEKCSTSCIRKENGAFFIEENIGQRPSEMKDLEMLRPTKFANGHSQQNLVEIE